MPLRLYTYIYIHIYQRKAIESIYMYILHLWAYTIAGLDRWTGPVDWNGGLAENRFQAITTSINPHQCDALCNNHAFFFTSGLQHCARSLSKAGTMPPRIIWSVNWSVRTQRVTTSGSLLEAYRVHVAEEGLGVGLLLSRALAGAERQAWSLLWPKALRATLGHTLSGITGPG